jgi:hypothetical protein
VSQTSPRGVVPAMRTLDPLLPFKIGPMNGWEGLESGLRPKA